MDYRERDFGAYNRERWVEQLMIARNGSSCVAGCLVWFGGAYKLRFI